MSLINLGLIFVAGLDLGFAILIYFLNPKNKINISLALTVFFLATWTFSMGMFRNASTELSAILWTWIQNESGSLLVIPFFFFSLYFPYQKMILKKWQIVTILMSIIIITLVVVISNAWASKIYLNPPNNDYLINFWGIAYFNLHFYVYLALSFYILLKKYRENEGFIKKQLKYLIVASGIIAIFGGIFGAIIPLVLLHSAGPYWIGPYFAVPTVIILLRFIYKKD